MIHPRPLLWKRRGAALPPLSQRGGSRGGFLLLLFVLTFSLPAFSQQPPTPSTPDRQQALEAIRGEIGELEERFARLQREAKGLAGELASVEVELQLQQRRLHEAEAARELAVARTEEGEAAVAALEADLAEAREGLRKRLRGLYRLGAYGYVRLLLAIEPGADPLRAVRSMRYLARRDADAIDRYVAVRDDLTKERDALLAEQREVEAWAEQEASRRQRLAQIRARQARLLAQVEAEQAEVAERAGELKEKERKLASLLDLLASDAEEPLEGKPIQVFRGVLDWPVVGEVAVGFGTRRDARYNTELPHNGIDIQTVAGSEVHAVYPGEVLFAAPFEGYGTMVVIHHPGRVFSVYGGLTELRVAKGDMVSLGGVLGVASTRLYLEIRADKRPEDPLIWLR